MASSTNSIVFLILGLLLGAVVGYVGLSMTGSPDVTNYETQISTLTGNLATAHTTISTLNASLQTAQSTIADLQVNQSLLETQIDAVFSIGVTQRYEWEWAATEWFWELPLTIGLYVHYWEKERPTAWSDWVDMVNTPDDDYDDYYINMMIDNVKTISYDYGFTEIDEVNFVISFVQSLPYTVDDVTTAWNEYPRYPIETLFDRGGDCEDTSILVAALLEGLGYDCALLILDEDDHCAVGVDIDAYGTYYEVNGVQYFYLETTGEGWEIGQQPDSFPSTTAYVYPID
jgi:hypothetical protein